MSTYHARSAYHFCLKSKNITFVLQITFAKQIYHALLARHIPPPYGATTNCVRSLHGGSRTPALRCKCVQSAKRTRRHQGTALRYKPLTPEVHFTTKARPNFRYRHSDKTRACLRFAKIHSKANRKSDFCDSESLASTHPPQAVPLSRLRTRSNFGSNSPLDCYSLPK